MSTPDLTPAQQLEQAKLLLGRVYAQCGNHCPAERRHALTPGLRDDIRDFLKETTGYFGQTAAAASEGK